MNKNEKSAIPAEQTNFPKPECKHKHDLPVDDRGFYGDFGGAFVPDALKANLDELADAYYKYIEDPAFLAEWKDLLDNYAGRPSPLYYARRLSEHYNTHVYLKREDLNHTGAHKINNALGQALLAIRMGKKRVIAETGAGQHGTATATVCALLGLECIIFMGEIDMERQRPNVERMQLLGAKVVACKSGGRTLQDAVNEALQYWIDHADDTFYLIGSAVGPHPYPEMVARFQSVISQELLTQVPQQTGAPAPDYVIACIGGGSNASGGFYHYLNNPAVKLIGVEAAGLGVDTDKNAATITLGQKAVLHGSRTLVQLDAEGKVVNPYSVSPGLDYPGVGPLHAYLASIGRVEVLAATDTQALDAAYRLSCTEGIIPAIESSHALAALDLRKFNPNDNVVIILSGRGDKDLATYLDYKPTIKL